MFLLVFCFYTEYIAKKVPGSFVCLYVCLVGWIFVLFFVCLFDLFCFVYLLVCLFVFHFYSVRER